MKNFNKLAIAFLILLVFIGFTSMYTITEGQHGILLRLGKIKTDASGKGQVNGPGLHFKLPLVNHAAIFDTRMQTLDIKSSRIVTEEKKDVLVDYYVKWRIRDVPLYFTRTGGSELKAETLLEQKLNDGLRAQFGKRNISEVVSGERVDIMKILKDQSNESAKDLGIDVIDVRIKRIDLPAEVSIAVYARMRAERERIANGHRAEGRSSSEVIRGQADADVTVILAKAQRNSKIIRGEGDAKAAEIYAKAYSKNPSFFAFFRSIHAYQKAFNNKKDMLVLKPGGQFFKYFNNDNPQGEKSDS